MHPTKSEELRARIGPAMRALRVEAGLSQRSLAVALGVSRSTYSYYELGITTPCPQTLFLLAQFYGVPMERFFKPVSLGALPKRVRKKAGRADTGQGL